MTWKKKAGRLTLQLKKIKEEMGIILRQCKEERLDELKKELSDIITTTDEGKRMSSNNS